MILISPPRRPALQDVPHAFTSQLPRLVDIVVQSLDPHVPLLRDSCLEDRYCMTSWLRDVALKDLASWLRHFAPLA
jgi:hypothetical protein